MTIFILFGAVGGWCAITYIVLRAYKALHARRKARKADYDTFIGANVTAVATPHTAMIAPILIAPLPTKTVAETPVQAEPQTQTETPIQQSADNSANAEETA